MSSDAVRQVETDIKLIGTKNVNGQIVLLLAYIRNLLKNPRGGEIKISVGKNIRTDFFAFQVNDEQVPDILARETLDIN